MEQELAQTQGMPPMEDMGRGTDTVMAHLSLGEVVIPRSFLDDPQVMEMLQVLFEQNGADLAQYTVGDPANSINPETGYPEFFLKKIKRLVRKVSNVVLPQLGAVGGFTNGLIQGEGLGGALKQGVQSGLSAAATIAGAKYLSPLISEGLGSLPGSTLSNGAQGATQGTGIAGAIGRATGLSSGSVPSIGGIVGGASGGGGSSFSPLNLAANIYGGYQQDEALKKQKEQLLAANQQQQQNLESFDPSNITSDAGYQFNLEQGQRGLNAGLAAGGSLMSGRALKAASEYNQQYANNAFDSAYQRWLQQTTGKNALVGAGGDIRANATGARAQNVAQSLSNALGARVGQYGSDADLLRRLGLA